MRTCTNGNTNVSVSVCVCVSTRTHSRVLICCLFGFFCFVFAFALLGQPSPLILGKRMMLRDTYERVHNMLPFSLLPLPLPLPLLLLLTLPSPGCACASVCEFMHTNWKISDLWFVPAKRSVAKRRTASKTNSNSKITTTNRQQVTPKPAIERAETPEQTASRARARAETQRPTRMRLRVPKAPTTHSCRRSQRRWQQQVNVKLIKRQCTVGPCCDNNAG